DISLSLLPEGRSYCIWLFPYVNKPSWEKCFIFLTIIHAGMFVFSLFNSKVSHFLSHFCTLHVASFFEPVMSFFLHG
ncbi:hypothetical protein, partial [Serratia ureilytica]|uniref:hypothetical protein n=1 Tax=Serratia ureilytica TaxID=300181 RepID=UPI003FA79D48